MSSTRNVPASAPVQHGLFATLCGPAAAGFAEMFLFYPAEVIARRMEAHKNPLSGMLFRDTAKNIARVAVGGNLSQSPFSIIRNLYAGLGMAAGYRVAQRGYKYGGHPVMKQALDKLIGEDYRLLFGDRQARVMLDGTAGLAIGIGEAPVLLPADLVKVRLQVNRPSVQEKGIIKFMVSEGWQLYRGLGVTMARNAIGATAFFTTYSYTREHMTQHQASATHLTTAQKLCASTIATIISITLSHPLDVMKTRLQSGLEPVGKSGFQIAAEMIQREGLFSLWKGYFIKIPTAGPRVVFTYALAQTITEALAEWLRPVVHCTGADIEEAPQKPSLR